MDTFAIERVREWGAEVAIVLGSGLSALVTTTPRERLIPYQEIPELPRSTITGHAGRFVLGEINNTRVVFAQGRIHLYEGYTAREVTTGIRFLARAGILRLILTNAAGAINPEFRPGSWMLIRDHLNLTGVSPLSGSSGFVDMTKAYSLAWRERLVAAARTLRLTLYEGIYAALSGPQYETPAEVRMLHSLGADAVGMSTVCETIQARALGLEVAGLSCLTNWAAGLANSPMAHEEVLTAGASAAGSLRQLLEGTL